MSATHPTLVTVPPPKPTAASDAPEVLVVRVLDPFSPVASRTSARVDWSPGLTVRALFDARERGMAAEFLHVHRNGVPVEPAEWDRPVGLNDVLMIAHTPGGPLAAVIGKAIIMAAISAAVGFLASKLFAPPGAAHVPQDEESGTYGWSGLRSIYNSNGQPIPVVYGEHRTGGLVISQWVQSSLTANTDGVITDAESVLRVLLLLSHGPVESIGEYTTDQDDLSGGTLPEGLQIDGNDVDNYQGVRAWLRMGHLNQTAIPGFEAVRTYNEVGLLIDQESVASGNAAVIDWSLAVGFDMDSEANSVLMGLLFPFGLYSLSGSSLATETVQLQLRYQELDGSGIPTGPWAIPAFFDDGTPNPVTIHGAIQSEFVKQVPLTFYDPATFTPQASGKALLCRKGSAYMKRANLDGLNAGWAVDEDVSQFSIEISYRYFQGVTAGSNSANQRVLFGWVESSGGVDSTGSFIMGPGPAHSLQGISAKWTDSNGSATIDEVGLEIEMGYGSSNVQGNILGWNRFLVTGLFTVTNGAPVKFGQITLTFGTKALTRTLTVYHDGVPVAFFSGPGASGSTNVPRLKAPGVGNEFFLGSADQMTAAASGTFYDQCRVLARVLSAGEVAAAWNGGTPGGAILAGPPAKDLVAIWSMNPGDFTGMLGSGNAVNPYYGGTVDDLSGNGLDLSVVSLGATPGTGVEEFTGWVYDGQLVGTAQRARYRIQWQRLDLVADDTDTKDVVRFDHVITVDDYALIYPECALLGVEIQGSDQLSGTRPNVTTPMRGKRVLVWDGDDPEHPSFVEKWTASPPWIFLDALTARYGLGAVYSVKSAELESMAALEAYAAELVSDLKPAEPLAFLRHGSWPSGSDLEVEYPDGYLELQAALAYGESWAQHLAVLGKFIKLTGTVGGGAPSWAATLLDGGPYEVVQINVNGPSGTPEDSIRMPWPSDIIAAPPSPTEWVLSSTSSTVSAEGREERLQCDIVLDRGTETAWDQLLKLANAGRSVPVRDGSKIRLKTEKPREAVAVFSSSNIVEGSFRLTAKGRREEFNAATMDILDRDQNYERVTVELQHSSLQDETQAQNVRRKTFAAEGITRRSQALRELRVLLNTSYLVRVVAEFEVDRDGTFVEAGDVALVTHDLPLWAYSGRCLASTEAADSFVLDRPVTLAASTTYYAAIKNGATDEIEVLEVATAAGDYEAGEKIEVVAPFGFVPARLDLWTIGQAVTSAKLFQVIETTLNPLTGGRMITAVVYDSAVFDETGFPELQPVATELDMPNPSEMPKEFSVKLGDGSGQDEDTGAFSKAINVSWSYPPRTSQNVSRSAIWLAEQAVGEDEKQPPASAFVQVGEVDGKARTFAIQGRGLRLGRPYAVKVQPIGRQGQRPSLARLGGGKVHLRGRADNLVPPDSAMLLLKGGLGYYTVEQPVDGARGVAAEFRRGGWILGTPILTLGASSNVGAATQDWTLKPSSPATGLLLCRNRLQSGQYTAAVPVTVALDQDQQIYNKAIDEDLETAGWTAGGAALTDLAVNADGELAFSGSALTGVWESKVYDITGVDGLLRMSQLSVEHLADQIHPRAWETLAKLTGGAKGVEGEAQLVTGTPFAGGQGAVKGEGVPQGGFRDSWGGAFGKQWSWEGPVDSLDGENAEACTVSIEIRAARVAVPTNDYEPYRPGRYWCRTFQVRVTFTRPDTTYDLRLRHLNISAMSLREDVVDGGSAASPKFIFFKRDSWANISALTPADGEPLWVNNHKRLFVGDGTRGVFVGCACVFHSRETDGANYGSLATVLWKSDQQKGPEITHSTSSSQDEITFAVPGFYVISYQLFGISATGGVSLEAIIYMDTGSGYAPLDGSQSGADFSAATRRGCAQASVPVQVTGGTKIKIWARGIAGSGSVNLTADQSTVTIYRMSEATP